MLEKFRCTPLFTKVVLYHFVGNFMLKLLDGNMYRNCFNKDLYKIKHPCRILTCVFSLKSFVCWFDA